MHLIWYIDTDTFCCPEMNKRHPELAGYDNRSHFNVESVFFYCYFKLHFKDFISYLPPSFLQVLNYKSNSALVSSSFSVFYIAVLHVEISWWAARKDLGWSLLPNGEQVEIKSGIFTLLHIGQHPQNIFPLLSGTNKIIIAWLFTCRVCPLPSPIECTIT